MRVVVHPKFLFSISFFPLSLTQVEEKLVEVDNLLGMLMDGLLERGLDRCVNIIVLADHGRPFLFTRPLAFMGIRTGAHVNIRSGHTK